MPMAPYFCEPHALSEYLTRIASATPDEIAKAGAQFGDRNEDDDDDDIYDEDGDEAQLQIAGILSEAGPPYLAKLFGIQGTSYAAIRSGIARAEANPAIKTIRLNVNSPGGEVNGVDSCWQALRASSKPTIAINNGLMASAAYYLASGCDKIVAMSPNDETGSIGCMFAGYDDTDMLGSEGVKRINIYSKNADRKDSSFTTKEGRAELQDRADAQEAVFLDRVATGRRTTIDNVKQNFGHGSVMIAEHPDRSQPDAISVGMIDGLMVPGHGAKPAPGNGSGMAVVSASGKTDYPIVDKPWDVNSASERWRSASKSADTPSDSYKDGFFWYDETAKGKYGSYKLQFADIVDGKSSAIRRAILACNGVMSGARGGVDIPDKDRKAVQARIDGYMNKIKAEDKKSGKKTSAQAERGNIMNLNEFLADNPQAQAEIETLKQKAFNSGAASIQARIDAAKPFLALQSAKDGYTAIETSQIGKFALEVVTGAKDIAMLQSFAAMVDMGVESRKTAAAVTEQPIDTPAGPDVNVKLAAALAKVPADQQQHIQDWAKAQGVDGSAALVAAYEQMIRDEKE